MAASILQSYIQTLQAQAVLLQPSRKMYAIKSVQLHAKMFKVVKQPLTCVNTMGHLPAAEQNLENLGKQEVKEVLFQKELISIQARSV